MHTLIRHKDNRVIASRLTIADTFYSRFRGLLGVSEFGEDCAMLLSPCKSVHTFAMSFAIDILFLNRQSAVVGLASRVPAWRVVTAPRETAATVEMTSGSIDRLNLRLTDELLVKSRLN